MTKHQPEPDRRGRIDLDFWSRLDPLRLYSVNDLLNTYPKHRVYTVRSREIRVIVSVLPQQFPEEPDG